MQHVEEQRNHMHTPRDRGGVVVCGEGREGGGKTGGAVMQAKGRLYARHELVEHHQLRCI